MVDAVVPPFSAVMKPERAMELVQRIDLFGALEQRLLGDQRLHQLVHVFELLDRRPSRVARLPLCFRRQPDGEGLGKILVGMALRVPRVQVLDEALAVRARRVKLGIRLRRAAENLAALAAQPQLVGVVDDVTGFVAQDAHAPLVFAALDRQHLGFLEAFEPRMREVERHRHRRLAVGREPFVRQVKVERKGESAPLEFRLELRDARLDDRAVELDRQVRQAKAKQLFVGEIRPVEGSCRAGHRRP